MAGAANGVSEKTVRKYIKVKSNWNYLDKLTDKQQKKIPNLNENILPSSKGGYNLGRSVQIKDQTFSSILKASTAFNIDPHTVRKRIASSNFIDWKWSDDCNL